MKELLGTLNKIIGHNIVRYDIPVIERLLSIKIEAELVDTLALSWALFLKRPSHGLESWGVDLGIEKPPIEDWFNLSLEEYVHRCTEDVKINLRLWRKMYTKLCRLYDNEEDIWRYINYLTFKMDCAREQEKSRWKLDKRRATEGLDLLEKERTEKISQLSQVMPKVPIVHKKEPPKKPYKKDGSLSTTGARWQSLLRKQGLPENYSGSVDDIIGWQEPNPGSQQQIKSWLFSLGWEPSTYKIVRDKETNEVRQIPQINKENSAGICDSIKLLYEKEPRLELLDGLSIVTHRISILKGFLGAVSEDGYVKAEIQGLTNTLRFKHKVCVNLPKITKPYGELMRGVLICDEDTELCGSDMSSLEDRLKQHFIYPYDPDYVEEMNVEDYDPHLALALLGEEVTQEQVEAYKSGTDKSIKPIRDIFKNGNYACQYGAMPPRLALTAHISLAKAKQVWEIYWKKNWAIKKAAEDQLVKKIDGEMWLLNPVNGFYYSLKYDKDRFSTLVQGTASYVFDEWIREFRTIRPQLTAQFHDEVVLQIKQGHREQCTKLLRTSIDKLNNRLKLNRLLDIDVQFGQNYAEIH